MSSRIYDKQPPDECENHFECGQVSYRPLAPVKPRENGSPGARAILKLATAIAMNTTALSRARL